MLDRRLGFSAAIVLAAVLVPTFAAAHDLPANRMLNAFVKIEPGQAQLVVRVPLDLLRGLPLPTKGSEYDLTVAGPATKLAVHALADGLPLWEDGVHLVPSSSSGRLSLPSDRSFEDYDRALQTADRPTDPDAGIYYAQGFLDAHFIYPISSPKSVFKIQLKVAADLGNLAKLTIRYMPLGESSRALVIASGAVPVALNPAWYHAASGFVVLGIEHITSGIDHLLFLCCLVIPFRRIRRLIPVITAFTVAHSFTLLGSAYHLAPRGAWFPPFVETAVAASIVYMALENIIGTDLRRRWLVTGAFGLVHGFAFSSALQEQLQFAGSHLLTSLFSFNVGVEIGQLLVLALMVPLFALFRRVVAERMGVVVLSAIIAHTGWHWMLERWQVLWQTGWPRPDAASLMVLARWVAGLLLVGGAARVLARWVERRWASLLQARRSASGSSPM